MAGTHLIDAQINLIYIRQYDLTSVITGIIFYQNEDGDVLDIQADIIGPGKSSLPYS